jgi:hypothetical protein
MQQEKSGNPGFLLVGMSTVFHNNLFQIELYSPDTRNFFLICEGPFPSLMMQLTITGPKTRKRGLEP